MEFNEMTFGDVMPVDGYGPGFFRVGGEIFEGPMVMAGAGPASWGGLEDIDRLVGLRGAVDVIFIGLGPEMRPVPAVLRAALEAVEIGVEGMTTPSACRTYNVLLSEGRRVALAALPV